MKFNVQEVVAQYSSFVIRWYVIIRFLIINIDIIEKVLHYIPRGSKLVNFGCGFGLFDCVIGLSDPRMRITGYDLNTRRIQLATETARRLNLVNLRFFCADVTRHDVREECGAILMLDLLHHVDYRQQQQVLEKCHAMLEPGGVLVIKDIHKRNKFKLWFTYVLDAIMTKNAPVYYFNDTAMFEYLQTMGFYVIRIRIRDWLPYPHILFICYKDAHV